jgi:hypothetical protein
MLSGAIIIIFGAALGAASQHSAFARLFKAGFVHRLIVHRDDFSLSIHRKPLSSRLWNLTFSGNGCARICRAYAFIILF